jgi:[ribosomal protein S18]-alanine N-acetyltransferase
VVRLVVESMDLDDISEVLEVDRESYTMPWPASAYRREILHNRNARYFVLRELSEGASIPEPRESVRPRFSLGFLWRPQREEERQQRGRIVGYAGMWLMVDEAHITTIAVRSDWRGKGFGELLLASLIEAAQDIGGRRVTLEVRVSNEVAQGLYRKYGFQKEGLRPRYYSDNNEDAYIMTTGDIRESSYRRMFDEHIQSLQRKLQGDVDLFIHVPGLHVHMPTGETGSEP